MMPNVYLTSKDLEKKYQISRSTVDNWKKEGLPHIKIGRSVRFDEAEVDKWINTRLVRK